MNRRSTVLMVILIVVVVGGALAIGLNGNKTAINGCSAASSVDHKVTIQAGKVSASQINGKPCDKLTIVNQDNEAREIAFGAHEHHEPYDGVAERVLNKGQALTVTLNKAGTYHWHDHLHDEVEGYFTVTQ